MNQNPKPAADMFLSAVVVSLLLLTAWGNAIAMLIFSVVAIAVWFSIPRLRKQTPVRHTLLMMAVSISIAMAIANVMSQS